MFSGKKWRRRRPLGGVELRRIKSLNERRKKPQEARRRMSRADGSPGDVA